jgi:ATP-binding cassette subfamily F protein uup
VAVKNLINVEAVSKSFGIKPLLENVSLGINAGERIGVVGRNGGGKSTLMKVIAGLDAPDTGRVSKISGLSMGILNQADSATPGASVRDVVLGEKRSTSGHRARIFERYSLASSVALMIIC